MPDLDNSKELGREPRPRAPRRVPDPSLHPAPRGGGSGIVVSVFSAEEPVGKRRGLNADGTLRKTVSAPRPQSVKQVEFETIEAFAQYALDAPASEAIAFGLCPLKEARVAVADSDKRQGVVARTKQFFTFADGPGVMLLDCDPLPGERPMSAAEIVDALRAAVPELCRVALAAKPSSSAHLHAPDGTELVGAAGVHLFVPVWRAKRIPRWGAIIADRLWLAGHGRIKITGNGTRLHTTLIDTSVWSPERLCFARAACQDGVEQRFDAVSYFPGDCDDLAGEGWLSELRPLTEHEAMIAESIKDNAYAHASPQAQAKREQWAEARLSERLRLARQRGEKIDCDAVKASLLSGEHVLPPDIVLYPVGSDPITAGEMFREGARWDGVRLADPFEPDYGGDPRIALAVFNCAEPHIYSHAHGGQRFLFRSESERDAELTADFEDLGAVDRKRRKFEATPAGEFVKGPAPSWLVKGVLPEAALGVVYGASGSGKTFFVLDLVAAVARCETWRDRKVKQGVVAYVCAEGVAGFRNRVQAYMRQHDVDFGDQLLVVSQPPNLLLGDDAKALGEEIKLTAAKIVVVDTFAQVMPGADENSSIDVGKALKVCRDIHTATGALVLLIHHSGKDATRGARGWSGTRAAADVEIEIAKNDRQHTATITKMKDGEDGAEFGFRLIPILLGHDEDGDEITSCIVSPCEVVAREPAIRRGANQRAVIEAFHDLITVPGGGVAIDAVLDHAVDLLPVEEGKRDRRREYAKRALREIINQGEIIEAKGMLNAAADSEPERNLDQ